MSPEEARQERLVQFFDGIARLAVTAARHASAGDLDWLDSLLEEIEAQITNAQIHIAAIKLDRGKR